MTAGNFCFVNTGAFIISSILSGLGIGFILFTTVLIIKNYEYEIGEWRINFGYNWHRRIKNLKKSFKKFKDGLDKSPKNSKNNMRNWKKHLEDTK